MRLSTADVLTDRFERGRQRRRIAARDVGGGAGGFLHCRDAGDVGPRRRRGRPGDPAPRGRHGNDGVAREKSGRKNDPSPRVPTPQPAKIRRPRRTKSGPPPPGRQNPISNRTDRLSSAKKTSCPRRDFRNSNAAPTARSSKFRWGNRSGRPQRSRSGRDNIGGSEKDIGPDRP